MLHVCVPHTSPGRRQCSPKRFPQPPKQYGVATAPHVFVYMGAMRRPVRCSGCYFFFDYFIYLFLIYV